MNCVRGGERRGLRACRLGNKVSYAVPNPQFVTDAPTVDVIETKVRFDLFDLNQRWQLVKAIPDLTSQTCAVAVGLATPSAA